MNNNKCPCPSCVKGLTSSIHQNDEYKIDTIIIKENIPWDRLPYLRPIFKYRPSTDPHWHELVYLIKKASNLIDCNCKSLNELVDDIRKAGFTSGGFTSGE